MSARVRLVPRPARSSPRWKSRSSAASHSAREADVEPLRAEVIQEAADRLRAADRHDDNALRVEVAAAAFRERLDRALVAAPLDEDDRAWTVDRRHGTRGTAARKRYARCIPSKPFSSSSSGSTGSARSSNQAATRRNASPLSRISPPAAAVCRRAARIRRLAEHAHVRFDRRPRHDGRADRDSDADRQVHDRGLVTQRSAASSARTA